MAWRRSGDNPWFSSLLTHICVIRLQYSDDNNDDDDDYNYGDDDDFNDGVYDDKSDILRQFVSASIC